MKHLQSIKALIVIFFFSVYFTSCSKENLSSPEDVTNITVKLKSTTGQIDKVYLDIEDVQLKIKESISGSEAWISLDAINQGLHNACDFKEDNPLLLVDDIEIEASYVYEIRLVLGNDNFIEINNVLHSLDVLSLGNANPSNLIETQLNPKRRYDVVIDINIDESVSFNTNENMMVLNPKLYTAIRQIEY